MSYLKFPDSKMPQAEEMMKRYNPPRVDPIAGAKDILSDLVELEQKYGMDSSEFYEKFSRAEIEECWDFNVWYVDYCAFLSILEAYNLKRSDIESD